MSTSRSTALRAGALVLVFIVAGVLLWSGYSGKRDDSMLRIQLRTMHTGDGIGPGAGVRYNGVPVGALLEIESEPTGSQLITLALDRAQLFDLTDGLNVDYAPANLFGISEVILERGTHGATLREGTIIDMTGEGRINDVTMGTLLRSLSQTTTDVLTPQLTEVLTKLGTDIEAFTPLIQAVIGVSRAVADTQQYPPSQLIEQYASFLSGVSGFTGGFLEMIGEAYNIAILRTDRDRFNVGVSLVVDQLFPSISDLLDTANSSFSPYSGALAILVGQLARTVPDPARSHADLAELLGRIDRTFQAPPDGPQVSLDVLVRGMPGLTVPLLGGALPAAPSGGS